MPTIEESIDVAVPVRTAYDQWTQFEQFPRFGDAIGASDRQVRGDLERFKEPGEDRGAASGGWRGDVPQDPTR